MEQFDLMDSFLNSVQNDARIGPNHISLFVALVKLFKEQGKSDSISVFRKELIPISKLCGTTTYYKTLRELHQFGYIHYTPSYNHFLGSLIWIKSPYSKAGI